MCFKKKPIVSVPIEFVKRRLISASINDYPGSINDLRGCLNDSRQAKDTLLTHWPDFDVRRLLDDEATVSGFKSLVNKSIATMNPGGTVCVISDSCFSATNTRLLHSRGIDNTHLVRNRFYATPGEPLKIVSKPFFPRSDLKWIAISACGETQTAADAYINDNYHGAFTWYAFRLLRQGITYRQWFYNISQYLPSSDFEQAPTIEGPDYLLDSLVCSDNTLIIHNSTHGTQLRGYAEEEIDEAICFYDGNLRDNEYFQLLNKIV
jgi:hypothetical protein